VNVTIRSVTTVMVAIMLASVLGAGALWLVDIKAVPPQPVQASLAAAQEPEQVIPSAPQAAPDLPTTPVPMPQFAQAPAQLPPPPAPPPTSPEVPSAKASDTELVFTLVRTTLVALHQANVTGNYTVVRDLSSPGFREKNSAADLARIFAPIRDAKIDLGAVVILDPHVSRVGLNEQKMLNIAGALETKPVPVSFELLFQPLEGVWRLNGIAVSPMQPGAQPTPTPVTPPARKRDPPKSSPKQ
jgi:hypothetical protein